MERSGRRRGTLHRVFFNILGTVLLTTACRPPAITRSDASRLVSREGLTLVIVRGPVEFQMGSPDVERGRNPASDSPDERLHKARIPRSYAIGTHEITVAQFRRFLEANPAIARQHQFSDSSRRIEDVISRFSPEPEMPQIVVTWYEAAMFCNWLSARDGLPLSEWVYPVSMAEIRHGMQLPANYLHRTGYRLPTEAEWEYAVRAGTSTARFFGESDSLLGEYAWYARHPQRAKNDPVDPSDPQRTAPVGTLKPNPMGLFDVYGNVWEWTQSRIVDYPSGMHVDAEDAVLVVSDSAARGRRGGAFPYGAAFARSAARGTVGAFPYVRRDNVGFRVARTIR